MKMNKVLIGIMTVLLSIGAMAAEPTISGVTVQQRWPWSRLVDIDYVLTSDPGQPLDITIKAYDGLDLLALPASSFSGDANAVTNGQGRIVWDPTTTPYAKNGILQEFRVELTPVPVPLYMIVDLTMSMGDAGQIEYVHESDLTNDVWGAWVRNPVTNEETVVESVIWTDVTNNVIYKTDKLVLRRVRKGTFIKGSGPSLTTVSKDFYTGVFQVTQRQWELIMGDKPSEFNNVAYYQGRPVEKVSYDDIRGATNSTPVIDWPSTGAAVIPASFMGKLRAKTGLLDFDLATDVQWEYACRAGTTTRYNDGISGTLNTTSNAQINVLGRYAHNGGMVLNGEALEHPARGCGPENGTAIVGSYLPNAWGLYDTHGNVWEFCLDWNTEITRRRLDRGGPYDGTADFCFSATRSSIWPHGRYRNYGFRLVINLP
ncbi:MAG: formylglycine-generating enzyme family protein [Kiritimatiellia bacterium]